MSWIRSSDGTTVEGEFPELPARHQRDPNTGEWVKVTETNAADFGAYPLQRNDRPDRDHVRSVVNQSPGVFVETWTLDDRLAAENAEADERRESARTAQNRMRWFDARAQQWLEAPTADDQQSIMDQVNAMHLDWVRSHTQLAELTFAVFGLGDEQEGPPDPVETQRKRTDR